MQTESLMTTLELRLAEIMANSARRRGVILVRRATTGQPKRMKNSPRVRRFNHRG
jgi:hypothetical protein